MGRLSWIAAIFGLAMLAAPAIASAQPWGPPPNWSWTGAYAGINIGAVSNTDNGQNTCSFDGVRFGSGGCTAPVLGKIHSAGFLGGLTLGYNWQAGPLVVGVEGDFDGTTLQGSTGFAGTVQYIDGGTVPGVTESYSESMSWLATERLRVGFTTSRDAMIYVTGGPAQAEWILSSNLAANVISFTTSGQVVTRNGWADGIGYEAALAPRMTMHIEALSYELSPYTTSAPGSTGGHYTAGKDFQFHGWTGRLGVDWKL